MNFFEQMNQQQAQQQPAPVFTDAEKDQLRPIVIEQYRNMTQQQQNDITGKWRNIDVPNFQNIWISRRPFGGYPNFDIVIRRQAGNGPWDVLFNTNDIPQPMRRGGKRSRRKTRRSRRSTRSRRSRRHR
jgi:hypothetical protein